MGCSPRPAVKDKSRIAEPEGAEIELGKRFGDLGVVRASPLESPAQQRLGLSCLAAPGQEQAVQTGQSLARIAKAAGSYQFLMSRRKLALYPGNLCLVEMCLGR